MMIEKNIKFIGVKEIGLFTRTSFILFDGEFPRLFLCVVLADDCGIMRETSEREKQMNIKENQYVFRTR